MRERSETAAEVQAFAARQNESAREKAAAEAAVASAAPTPKGIPPTVAAETTVADPLGLATLAPGPPGMVLAEDKPDANEAQRDHYQNLLATCSLHQFNLDSVNREISQESQPAKLKELRARRAALTVMLDEVQDELCLLREQFPPASLEEEEVPPSAPSVPPTKAPTSAPVFALPAPPSAPPAIASAYSPTIIGTTKG